MWNLNFLDSLIKVFAFGSYNNIEIQYMNQIFKLNLSKVLLQILWNNFAPHMFQKVL